MDRMNGKEAERFLDDIEREEACLTYIKGSVEAEMAITESITGHRDEHEAEGKMLAALLMAEVIFLNSHHWVKEWPEKARKVTSLNVSCSDVFAWACSDAEGIEYLDIEDLYDHWIKDPNWGPAVWCMKKRRRMPQKPVADAISKLGIWDLDQIAAEFS